MGSESGRKGADRAKDTKYRARSGALFVGSAYFAFTFLDSMIALALLVRLGASRRGRINCALFLVSEETTRVERRPQFQWESNGKC